jgi:hypothetical protein
MVQQELINFDQQMRDSCDRFFKREAMQKENSASNIELNQNIYENASFVTDTLHHC